MRGSATRSRPATRRPCCGRGNGRHAPSAPRTALTPSGRRRSASRPTADSDHSDAESIANTFSVYATGINTGDYAQAYHALTPASRRNFSLAEFAATHTSSYVFDVHVEAVRSTGGGVDQATVRFTSVQDADQGRDDQTCSLWRLQYRMTQDGDGRWLIDRAVPERGYPISCDG